MKAIAINNIGNAGFEVSKRTLLNRNNTAREVVIMNLISSIMIRDNDMKHSSSESKRTDMSQDHGFNLYKNLEFGKRESKHVSRNIHMDMICNRLV